MLPAWAYALTLVAISGGYGLKAVYKTPADRVSLAATIYHDAALAFLYGQLHGTSLGAIAAWRYLSYSALAAGLMSIFLVVRHTRADEEAGRLELIGSTAVGRHAPLAVAILVASLANVLVFVLGAAVLTYSGLPFTGSVAYALAQVSCGLVFAAVAAIAAQISGTARGARGIAITVLCVAFFFRAVGDSGANHGLTWLTWLSPIGWAELVRPFTGDRWWVLVLPAAATIAGIGVALALAAARDQGSGMVQARPGAASAGALLAGPAGLAWRQQRAGFAGWATGFLVGGLAIGVLADGISKLVGASSALTKALRQIGAQTALTNAYLAACLSLLALVASAYAVSVVLRVRSEETDGSAELVLTTPISRLRWAGCQLLVAAILTAAVLLVGGFGMGLGEGLATSSLSTDLPSLLGAALAQLPAVLAVAAVAAALVGLLPSWSVPGAWIAVAICGFIGVFGPALNLSQAVLDISPFTHMPKLPGGTVTAAPLIWTAGAALALCAVGLAGLRRRDIG